MCVLKACITYPMCEKLERETIMEGREGGRRGEGRVGEVVQLTLNESAVGS